MQLKSWSVHVLFVSFSFFSGGWGEGGVNVNRGLVCRGGGGSVRQRNGDREREGGGGREGAYRKYRQTGREREKKGGRQRERGTGETVHVID